MNKKQFNNISAGDIVVVYNITYIILKVLDKGDRGIYSYVIATLYDVSCSRVMARHTIFDFETSMVLPYNNDNNQPTK